MTVDDYIAAAPPPAQPILKTLRGMAKRLCPDADEVISYRIPAFRQGRVFFYFAAYKNHVGIYPPVKTPASLVKRLSPYRGPKGNLQFHYADDFPQDLAEAVIKALHKAYAITK